MPEYRRNYQPGGTFFFTVVTYRRIPIFKHQVSRDILHYAWEHTCQHLPFTTVAVCILPDHIHCIWTLPENDSDYSLRWSEIKRLFSKKYLVKVGSDLEQEESRIQRHEAAIWQRRFWEHTIRDEADFNAHINYIHYNPLKHGLVARVCDWPWSTFHRYVKKGVYEPGWGEGMEESLIKMHGYE